VIAGLVGSSPSSLTNRPKRPLIWARCGCTARRSCRLCGPDAEAVEFDRVLPVVTGGHGLGKDRLPGSMFLKNTPTV
jgi:hypothetical protein